MPQGQVGFVSRRRRHDAECNEQGSDLRRAYTMARMGKKPKSAYDLTMERLEAADRESGVKEISLSDVQKEAIAEARRVAASRLAEREILFRDAMRKTPDPAEREKAEEEYPIDRKRIEDDRDRAIESIRRGGR